MKFWKKKRQQSNNFCKGRSLRRKSKNNPRNPVISNDAEPNVMDLGPFNLQILEESNKQTYVNIQMAKFNMIIASVLSQLLSHSERTNKVQMNITLQPRDEPSNPTSIRYDTERERERPRNVISLDAHAFSTQYDPAMTIAKAIQCPECDKDDCYEIKTLDDSIEQLSIDNRENPEETFRTNNVNSARRQGPSRVARLL